MSTNKNTAISKKYATVHPPLVTRFMEEEEHKNPQSSIKAVKTKLHQAYGAYTQDNAHKKAKRLLDELAINPGNLPTTTKALLSLHASTKERLPHYTEFYDQILKHTGPVESILDIGCGYNPFSIPLIPTKIKAYHAYDIDTKTAELINHFLTHLNLPPQAKCTDLATQIPKETADLALMCKLLPVLEAQAQGSGYHLIRALDVRHLLLTYPLKSLSGREKGMTQHYTEAFSKAQAEGKLGNYHPIHQQQVGQEMLYFLARK